jgi:hypothetical protein
MPDAGMVGRRYLERGQPVTVLARWAHRPATEDAGIIWHRPPRKNAPRNVLIERADGTRTVRPFRGLRKAPQ